VIQIVKSRPDRGPAGARLRVVRLLATAAVAGLAIAAGQTSDVQFVFTSDAHYGLTRAAFQGAVGVDARIVNAAMMAKINSLPGASFPRDGGLRSGEPIRSLDFLAEGGDIANREEDTDTTEIQPDAVSWSQFVSDYINGLTVTDHNGQRAPVYIVPGNHDASNAVGFHRPMFPLVDKTSMVEIYNRMMAPSTPKTSATYDYARDRIVYSRDIGGVHFVFLMVWPDSYARAWMERDLSQVSRATPIILFTHDQPDAEAKHFTNPNGRHDINAGDLFENLLVDQFADGPTIAASSVIEQTALEEFVLRHPNVTAYFRGNSNWNQFYDWTGPRHGIALHTFRVDSPMKGAASSQDETKLSFQVVTIDMASRTMTVRECLWDADPHHPSAPVTWGASTTVALSPRPAASALGRR
jgi:hypothetical protein